MAGADIPINFVPRTENDTVAELARSAAARREVVDGAEHLHDVVLPPGHQHQLVDLERFQSTPRRKAERVELHHAESFSNYVTRHTGGVYGALTPYTLYAHLAAASVVAVLNDSGRDAAGWGDHRATLTLQKTKPWLLWTSQDGEPLTQEQFAEHIEAGLPEIVEPPAAEMYELAQTFQATLGANFRQIGRLADGRRALHFEEQISASAGEQGDIEIPREFKLHLAPFEAGREYELVARLRFRVRDSHLTLSYHLVHPEDVLEAAFDEVLTTIEATTGIIAFRGTPPVRG